MKIRIFLSRVIVKINRYNLSETPTLWLALGRLSVNDSYYYCYCFFFFVKIFPLVKWLLSLTEWKVLIYFLSDPNAEEVKDIYGLHGQVEHKLAFLRTQVPKEMKLVIIGHSIGSYFSLEILKHAPDLPVSMPPEVTVGTWLCTCTSPLRCPLLFCLFFNRWVEHGEGSLVATFTLSL